jgi:uncharacterized protein
MKIFVTLVLVAFLLPSIASAGELERGQQAYRQDDCKTAQRLLQPLAEHGNAKAQVLTGRLYEHGCGVPQDYALSYSWFRKAADQGNAEAEFNIAVMLLVGEGTAVNHAESMKWLRQAADHGFAEAEVALGDSCKRDCGHGRPDFGVAMRWFRKAASQEDATAKFKIGFMYLEGLGVKKDCPEAMKWLRQAADQGYPNAQAMIGEMYNVGSCGIKQDYGEAYFWDSLPGAKSNSPGHDKDDVSHLTPQQIEAVTLRVKEWKPTFPSWSQHD